MPPSLGQRPCENNTGWVLKNATNTRCTNDALDQVCTFSCHRTHTEPSRVIMAPMEIVEFRKDNFLISTDTALLQVDVIHDFLTHRSYWAQGRSLETTFLAIEHSLCFGLYDAGVQVGFARVITDYATFAWLSDVFVLESARGHGLGKWLVACITSHPGLQSLRRMILATRDAHELYRRYGGFETIPNPERWMIRQKAA